MLTKAAFILPKDCKNFNIVTI